MSYENHTHAQVRIMFIRTTIYRADFVVIEFFSPGNNKSLFLVLLQVRNEEIVFWIVCVEYELRTIPVNR